MVFNYRKPGQVLRQPGRLISLGDGFALTELYDEDGEADRVITVWDLTKNTTRVAADNDTDYAVTDGSHRILFPSGDDLVVRELAEGGRSKPRLLGLIAPTTLNNLSSTAAWKPEIDATKALGKGSLTIKNSKGKAVRTISVPAAPNGSIRDITWNGRTTSGTRVPAGTYTWELTTPAADGTGNLVRVDGTSALKNATGINGTIKVTSKSLGTVKGATPKISDTTPVAGQTLTAKPGTWKPTGVTLNYQWYRDKKKISGATRTTYTVTTGDVGKKLTVKVTGTMDGWKTTTKTSKATGKVKRK
ncbi:MAG: FlgD immunoglobulin-like domain containing protein [Micropruina sp.]